ncbi:MAG: hypothetical protein Q9N68_01750 [Gammaproteobacteria bacterium]|nr:hypothetical protein [Gammaproteobacteria bacterium]
MAKKTFPCGHKGKGKFCHRCEQEHKAQELKLMEKERNEEWQYLFNKDEINLRKLPNKTLVNKARNIISSINSGDSYTKFKGKRMRYNRDVISIPLNHDFRVIYHDCSSGLKLQSLLSHEEYNVKKPGNKS